MKKLGILTFHSANNFGAVLQATSLLTTVQLYTDKQCELVNYEPDFIKIDYSVNPFKCWHLKAVIKNILRYRAKIKRNRLFDEFREKYLKCSQQCQSKDTFNSICNSYEKIIVGSDQVWNYRLTDRDLRYFLPSVSDSVGRYAYAASTGDATFTESETKKMTNALAKFQMISLREESSKTILKEKLVEKDMEVLLDPVFLTSSERWAKIASPTSDEPYILFFKMGYSKKADPALTFAKQLSKSTGYRLKLLWDQEMWFQYRDVDHIGVVGPSEFLGWISNAKCVVTNSFHATAFSIIFNVPFYTETEIDRKDRVLNILSTFGLQMCGLKEGKTVDRTYRIPNIEWDTVNNVIESEKHKSLRYIQKILADENSKQ